MADKYGNMHRVGNRRVMKRSAVAKKPGRAAVKKLVETPTAAEIAEIRKQLGDFKKESVVKLSESEFQDRIKGTLSDINKKLTALAKVHGITGEFKIDRRRFSTGGYGRYQTTSWVIVGLRPYTDKEIIKEGPKLLVQKERREKSEAAKREKDLLKLNELASRLGVTVTPNKKK